MLPFGVLSGLATWPFNAVQHDAISIALEDDPCTHPCGMGRTASLMCAIKRDGRSPIETILIYPLTGIPNVPWHFVWRIHPKFDHDFPIFSYLNRQKQQHSFPMKIAIGWWYLAHFRTTHVTQGESCMVTWFRGNKDRSVTVVATWDGQDGTARLKQDTKNCSEFCLKHGYGSIPIHTIFSGMNIHLPAILGFTRYQGFDPSPHL